MYTTCTPDALRAQKRVLDPMELEFTNGCEPPCRWLGIEARSSETNVLKHFPAPINLILTIIKFAQHLGKLLFF